MHVGAVDETLVAGSKGDSDVADNGLEMVVLRVQVVVAAIAL